MDLRRVQIYFCTGEWSGSRHILILTVRSSDNILQKSILRGHKSPPTPRHSASALRRPQVIRSAPCGGSSWLSAAHGRCGDASLLVCLSALLISAVRSGTHLHPPGDENNAWTHRTGGGSGSAARDPRLRWRRRQALQRPLLVNAGYQRCQSPGIFSGKYVQIF